jgi:hypothetical protein
MTATIVRYRVAPGRGEENAELVRAVYAELAALAPPGFRYATFVADDGERFAHVAFVEDGHRAPLPDLAAFRAFVAGIEERCAEPPEATTFGRPIGSYGFDLG